MDKGKDRARAKELFRQMTPKEKAEHIATYYSWHIIGVIAGVLAVILIINAVSSNRQRKDHLFLSVQQEYSVALRPILDHVTETGGWDEDINYAEVVSVRDTSGDGMNQVVVQLTANEMDVFICDRHNKAFVEEDPEAVYAAYELEDTVLGQYAQTDTKLYVLFLTGPRQEKTQRFERLLLGAA